MATTRLERKAKRNKSRAKNRVIKIKRLNTMPVIKNVDVEEIKKGFEKAPAKKAEKKVAAEATAEKAPKAEKPKKAAAEKEEKEGAE